ncbi:ubiquitin-like protein ATG12 [Dreissena polymorpha]|uniref:ubiquitin-like protein ATG12 n=1 Tax=Dreissena polymorpha TaxID=45954 RepID=UPI002263D9E7|nr:ubiquitin-like protein ATG12 [Dreissena polymorpha]
MSTDTGSSEVNDNKQESKEDVAAGENDTEGPTSPTQTKSKVNVLLKAAGDAPILKKKKYTLERNKRIAYISTFLSKLIKLESGESIFLYVNQSFAPALDSEVGSVFDCFGSDGKLVLHYCKSQAWG